MESYIAGAYWSARQESLESCALRVGTFLSCLSSVGFVFSGWRELGRSKKQAMAQAILDPSDIDQIAFRLEKGRSRYDISPRNTIEELGYSLSLWNGCAESEEAASLRIHCGDYSQNGGNAVVLDLPQCFDVSLREKVYALTGALVTSWGPGYSIITGISRLDEEAEKARMEKRRRNPFLDVALYLNEQLSQQYAPQKYTFSGVLGDGHVYLNI